MEVVSTPKVRSIDDFAVGFGWMEEGRLERASHVLVASGAVWLVDPLAADGLEERIRAAGQPAGVIQLLDRHGRDCGALAERLGIPLYTVPFAGIEGTPFSFRRVVRLPGWREVALWWPEERVLVCADALGTASYFRARGERLAVHPFLRLLPPRAMSRGLSPRHVLCGHGEGIHGEDASAALEDALATSRRRIPRWLVGQIGRKAF
jgi:glyoxylase-like metal-dependent hydrolase (beta-lactamase superfamily II)